MRSGLDVGVTLEVHVRAGGDRGEVDRRAVEVTAIGIVHLAPGADVLKLVVLVHIPGERERMPVHLAFLEDRTVPVGRDRPRTVGLDERLVALVEGAWSLPAAHRRHGRGARRVVGLAVVIVVEGLQVLGDIERGREAPGLLVLRAPAVDAGRVVLDDLVAVFLAVTEAGAQLAPLRQVEAGARDGVIEAPVLEAHVATELAGGLARDEVDRAARGVATEQRTLRSTQHFHAFQFDHVEHAALRLADIDAVDVHTHGRVHPDRRIAGDSATDRDDRDHRGAGALAERDVRRDAVQVRYALDAAHAQGLAAHGRHRDRNILDALLALLRGDHHFFELALLGERRQRRSGDGGRAEGPVHSHSSCSGLHDDSWLWGRNEARGMAGMPERPARSIRRPR